MLFDDEWHGVDQSQVAGEVRLAGWYAGRYWFDEGG